MMKRHEDSQGQKASPDRKLPIIQTRNWSVTAIATFLLLFVLLLPVQRAQAPESFNYSARPTWHNPPGEALAEAVPALPISFYRHSRLSPHIEHLDAACLRIGHEDRGTAYRAVLGEIVEQLRHSPLANNLLDIAERRRVLLCFDWDTELMAYYRAGLNLIGLNPHLKPGKMVAYLAHELAHVPQHRTYSDNRFFGPSDLVLLRRIREAAAEATATRITWQLRQAGYSDAWDLKAGDKFYGDISKAYHQVMEQALQPGTTAEVGATRAAFDAWFELPRRVALYDQQTLDHVERISSDRIGLVPPRRALSHDFLIEIARTEEDNYLSAARGPALTSPRYRGNLSADNSKRLAAILAEAGLPSQGLLGTDASIGQDNAASP